MENDTSHQGKVWDLKTRIESHIYENFDFTKTDFNSGIFNNVTFINCLFERSILANSRLFYDSNFDACVFKSVDLSNSTFGSHKGTYQNCVFENCNFKGREFNHTRFIDCEFIKCKLLKINFNASTFKNCKFIGKLEEVSFNGIYDTDRSEYPTLENVDFSQVTFGEFVTFYSCDFSTCIPPEGRTFQDLLYQLYEGDPSVLSTGSEDRIVLDKR